MVYLKIHSVPTIFIHISYLGTVVGGRRGAENGPAGENSDFSSGGGGGGRHFLVHEQKYCRIL